MNRHPYPSFPSTVALDRFFQRAFSASNLLSAEPSPRERIQETDSSYSLSIDLPGLRREELKLELKDRQLTLAVNPADERPFVAKETRSWTLGEQVDVSALSARLDLGVLRIELPKLTPPAPESITIDIQ
jgi:HSP20 family protein